MTRLLRRHDPILPLTQEPFEPGWVGFACVLIRREVVDSVGLLDDDFFMYFEDLDYCVRATRAGWKILYWPAARIVHIHGASSGSDQGRGLATSCASLLLRVARPLLRQVLRPSRAMACELPVSPGPHGFGSRGNSWAARPNSATTRAWTSGSTRGNPLRSRQGIARRWAERRGEPPPSHDAPLPRGDRNLNPRGLGLVALVFEDYRTHDRKLLEPGFVAIAVHRFGNARMDIRSRFLRALPDGCSIA